MSIPDNECSAGTADCIGYIVIFLFVGTDECPVGSKIIYIQNETVVKKKKNEKKEKKDTLKSDNKRFPGRIERPTDHRIAIHFRFLKRETCRSTYFTSSHEPRQAPPVGTSIRDRDNKIRLNNGTVWRDNDDSRSSHVGMCNFRRGQKSTHI